MRDRVGQFAFRGITQVSEADLRDRIGTTAPPRFLGFLWRDGDSFFDPTTFRRDLERISRYYRARGYYGAGAAAVDMHRVESDPHEIDITIDVHEGRPTTVGTVWLSGCETESRRPGDLWPIRPETCDRLRESLQLHPGAVFTEDSLARDQLFITDVLRNEGRARARVLTRVTADPALHRAHVVFLLEPGAPSQFGELLFHEPGNAPAADRELPRSRLSVTTLRRATRIRPGGAYSRGAIADAQAAILRLQLHGIVRMDEEMHDCDSHGRCDADPNRDRDDPERYVRVDLHVRLSPSRWDRLRFGGGIEYEQTRPNVHATVEFTHRNFPFLTRGFTIAAGPVIFFPVLASPSVPRVAEPGGTFRLELRQREVFPQTDFLFAVNSDLGLDPINPNLTSRFSLRPSIGFNYGVGNSWDLSTHLRATGVAYYNQAAGVAQDPIYTQQYINQFYYYFEQTVQNDRRDNPLQTRRGTFFRGAFQNGFAIPYLSNYSFVRTQIDFRGYVALSTNVVLAIRGAAGVAVGLGADLSRSGGWPVPQELRFFSGGANSNRGYPANRVGYLSTVPYRQCWERGFAPDQIERCILDLAGTVVSPAQRDRERDVGGLEADPQRLTAVGGLLSWELSAELRWYIGSVGLVTFFDMSDVRGWRPGPPVGRTDQSTPPAPTNAALEYVDFTWRSLHPSAGLGFRYVTSIGVIRLDVGVRLADLACSAYRDANRAQNVNTGGYPWSYAIDQPPCDVFGVTWPIAFHFAIGEAF